MKYKVKNTVTGEETICEKVVVGGFDYYVNGDEIKNYCFILAKNSVAPLWVDGTLVFTEMLDLPQWRKVIATTNKSLDLQMVVDEVEELAEVYSRKINGIGYGEENYHGITLGECSIDDFTSGYNKAKETYQFTKEDMVEFTEWLITKSFREGTSDYTTSELFDIWQEQITKTILVK